MVRSIPTHLTPAPAIGPRPYDFDSKFEQLVVYHSCSSPRFWGLVGRLLEPELMKDEKARDLISAAADFAKELGKGPDARIIVIQRLRRFVDAGKRTESWLAEREDYLDQVEDCYATIPRADDVAREAAYVVKRRIQGDIIQAAVQRFALRQDLDKLIGELVAAQRIGLVELSAGTKLGSAVFEAIDRLRHIDRLTVGVPDLDVQLDGGMGRSQLGIVLGGPGDGKSMWLSSLAAIAYKQGLNVAYATLELPESVVMARVIAHVTGEPISKILRGGWHEAKAILEEMQASGSFGSLIVHEFPPRATSVPDLQRWEDQCCDAFGAKVDLRIVDYADKLIAPEARGKSTYDEMGIVYEMLRYDALQRERWEWTASQTTRGKDPASLKQGQKKRSPDLDRVADSMHKVRVGDLILALNFDEETEMMSYRVAKNRHGMSRFEVGPIPTDFARGRIVAV